jgi:HlyD family secretion protein
MSTPAPRPIDTAPPLGPAPAPRAARPRLPRWLWIGLGLVALVLAYRWWTGVETDGVVTYITAKVDRGPIAQTVVATGIVNPVKTVQVGTYVSGPIIAIDVDYNSPVTRGQRVAKIDAASFAVKVAGAEASLATAKAQVEKDRADLALKRLQFERNRQLLARALIAQNDLDSAKSAADQAAAQLALDEANVQQQQANLDEARVNLGYTDIVSPVNGVVVARNVDVGQTVAASFQTPTLFLIAEDLTKMQVDTNVSEADVGRVRDDHPAEFTVDAYPGTTFRGTVAQVRNAPVTVQNVVTYDVVVAVDNTGLELKPGMTANVTITTARQDDVVRVPSRALRFKPETPGEAPKPREDKPAPDSRVYRRTADGSLEPVEVEIGIRNAQHAEIKRGGLEVGDEVVIGARRPVQAAPTATPLGGGTPGRRF